MCMYICVCMHRVWLYKALLLKHGANIHGANIAANWGARAKPWTVLANMTPMNSMDINCRPVRANTDCLSPPERRKKMATAHRPCFAWTLSRKQGAVGDRPPQPLRLQPRLGGGEGRHTWLT